MSDCHTIWTPPGGHHRSTSSKFLWKKILSSEMENHFGRVVRLQLVTVTYDCNSRQKVGVLGGSLYVTLVTVRRPR